jgi:hypothetical protein
MAVRTASSVAAVSGIDTTDSVAMIDMTSSSSSRLKPAACGRVRAMTRLLVSWAPGMEGQDGRRSSLSVTGRRLGVADRDQGLQLQEALLADALHVHQVFDIFFNNSQLNVHAGELEVRPRGAPTIQSGTVPPRSA